MKNRKKKEWMHLEQETIDDLEDKDWIHYKNGGCLCFAKCDVDCICGSWWQEINEGDLS